MRIHRLQTNGLRSLIFLATSGLLMGWTPANAYLIGFAWITLIPLWIWAQRRNRWQHAALGGFLWGFAYHGTALSWIWGLHPMTWMGLAWGTSLMTAIAGWAIVSLWGAIIPALVAIALYHLHQRRLHPVSKIWMSITLWCFLEWLWTQSPLWWTALSYTQSPSNTWILHLGQIAGPSLISAVLVGVNALLAEAYLALAANPREKEWWPAIFKSSRTKPWLISALSLFAIAHFMGGLLSIAPLTQTPQDALKIGIIQGNIPTRIKLFPQGLDRAFKDYRQGYQSLAAAGAEAVLMPEGAFPTRWNPDSARYKPLIQAIQQENAIAWIGAFMPAGTHITQSLVTVTPENSQYSQYDKVKLVPLGEYLPLEQSLGKIISRLTPLTYQMRPGSTEQLMQTPFGKATVSICYDSAFPQLLRRQTAAGGEFILSVANNDPYSARMMAQHHAQDVMRAIENDRWIARSTNTGFSSVITPHGQTEWRSQRNQYETYLTTIQKRTTRTAYVHWGSWFLWIQVFTSLVGLVFHLKLFPSH